MVDLFGKIAISINDVELWLDNAPCFNKSTSYNRRDYANFYDLASIIAATKLNGSFDVLEKQQTEFTERRQVSRYQTQYAPTQPELDLIAMRLARRAFTLARLKFARCALQRLAVIATHAII